MEAGFNGRAFRLRDPVWPVMRLPDCIYKEVCEMRAMLLTPTSDRPIDYMLPIYKDTQFN